MPAQKRHKTKYPGVYYIVGKHVTKDKEEKIYYIYYRKKGKIITEKAGRQFKDAMTPAKASNIRTLRVEGKELTNKEQREKVTQECMSSKGFGQFESKAKRWFHLTYTSFSFNLQALT